MQKVINNRVKNSFRFNWIKNIILIFGIVAFAFVAAPYGEVSGQEGEIIASKELKLRGKQLREEIDSTYQRLFDAGALKAAENPITDVVIKYIPIGISFNDAKEILRVAGFEVTSHEPNQIWPIDSPRRFQVMASINFYKDAPNFSRFDVHVLLSPRNPNDYSVVNGVYAYIERIGL